MDDAKLRRIAVRILRASSEYEEMVDDYMDRLTDAQKFLEVLHRKTPSPEGKAIVMGLHSDLFNFIADARDWARKLKFMDKSKKSDESAS